MAIPVGRPQLERLSETGCCGGSGFESRAVLGGKAGLQTGQTARGGEWPSYGSKVVLDLQLARRGEEVTSIPSTANSWLSMHGA